MTISFDAHPEKLGFRVETAEGYTWLYLYLNEDDRARRRSFGTIHLGSEDPRNLLKRLRAAIGEYEEATE